MGPRGLLGGAEASSAGFVVEAGVCDLRFLWI